MKLLSVKPSSTKTKKYVATFKLDNDKEKKVSFGAKGYTDYTLSKDDARKERYLNRHRARENWNDPLTPGALSRWILWNKKTIKSSIADFKKRFKL